MAYHPQSHLPPLICFYLATSAPFGLCLSCIFLYLLDLIFCFHLGPISIQFSLCNHPSLPLIIILIICIVCLLIVFIIIFHNPIKSPSGPGLLLPCVSLDDSINLKSWGGRTGRAADRQAFLSPSLPIITNFWWRPSASIRSEPWQLFAFFLVSQWRASAMW